jgi:hypothetical protein
MTCWLIPVLAVSYTTVPYGGVFLVSVNTTDIPYTEPVCDMSIAHFDNGVCTLNTDCVRGTSYEVVPPGSGTDRVCFPVSQCGFSEYETASSTLTTDKTCSGVTRCTVDEHVNVAATATTDAACRGIVIVCADGSYVNTSANVDGQNGTQCPLCSDGSTIYSPVCDTTWNSTRGTYTQCPIHHMETTCIVNTTFLDLNTWDGGCGDGKYYDASGTTSGHPARNCKRCRNCLNEVTACTNTADSVCGLSSAGSTGIQLCPKGQFRDGNTAGNTGRCTQCELCPLRIELKPCSHTSDRICAPIGTSKFNLEIIIAVCISFVVYIIIDRMIIPLQTRHRGYTQLSSSDDIPTETLIVGGQYY